MKQSSSIKQKLNTHNITCIEQFLDYSNYNILDWTSFHHNIQKIPRGKTPKWFKIITENIASSTNPSTVFECPNPFTFIHIQTLSPQWIITKTQIFGKVTSVDNNLAKIKHFNIHSLNSKQLIPCYGCKIRNPKFKTKHCYFTNPIHSTFRIQVDCQKRIHANLRCLYSQHKINQLKQNHKPILSTTECRMTDRFIQAFGKKQEEI